MCHQFLFLLFFTHYFSSLWYLSPFLRITELHHEHLLKYHQHFRWFYLWSHRFCYCCCEGGVSNLCRNPSDSHIMSGEGWSKGGGRGLGQGLVRGGEGGREGKGEREGEDDGSERGRGWCLTPADGERETFPHAVIFSPTDNFAEFQSIISTLMKLCHGL